MIKHIIVLVFFSQAAFNNLVWMILDVADKTLDITPLHKEDASKSQEGGKGGGFLSSLLG